MIPTVHERVRMFEDLKAQLDAQARPFGDRVQIVSLADDGKMTSGTKRNELARMAAGRYRAFVDDDDWVADDYVRQIVKATRSRPDVVTFDLRMTRTGGREKVQTFRIGHRDHHRLPCGRIGMTPNHLMAWRRDLADLCSFPRALGYGDDVFWYVPIREAGLAKLEVHLDAVLYEYRFHWDRTLQQTDQQFAAMGDWALGGVECFIRGRGEIWRATEGHLATRGRPRVEVEGPGGEVQTVSRRRMSRLCLVRMKVPKRRR